MAGEMGHLSNQHNVDTERKKIGQTAHSKTHECVRQLLTVHALNQKRAMLPELTGPLKHVSLCKI